MIQNTDMKGFVDYEELLHLWKEAQHISWGNAFVPSMLQNGYGKKVKSVCYFGQTENRNLKHAFTKYGNYCKIKSLQRREKVKQWYVQNVKMKM